MERRDRPVIVRHRVYSCVMRNRLVLFGPVGLTGPEAPLMRRASQQRRLGVLAVIASAPNAAISRDRVLGLLWPDRDEHAARHLLADSLYVLRRALGDRAIVAAGDVLRLSPDLVWSDVVEFRRAAAEERWADALALYCGDFLNGFHFRNAAEFDQWASAERTNLRMIAVRATAELATAFEGAGRLIDAVAITERRLQLVPSDEAALRDLVRLLIATDRRARAVVVARGFVERLARELNVPPSPETMQVVRDLTALGAGEPILVIGPRPTRRRGRWKTDSLTASIIAQGRHHWRQRTRASVHRAIEYFTRAAERDPRAVDAWCGVADSWIVMAGTRIRTGHRRGRACHSGCGARPRDRRYAVVGAHVDRWSEHHFVAGGAMSNRRSPARCSSIRTTRMRDTGWP